MAADPKATNANTSPVCPSLFYTIQVPEDTTVDSTVFPLTCDDTDSGVDGSLTYVISSGNDARKFNLLLTGTTANIKTAGKFDFDDINSKTSFTLEIFVIDGGTPPLKAIVTLDITLTPVNEFNPQFFSLPTSLVLNEDTDIGTMILDTKPFDQDLDSQRKKQKTKVTLTSSTSQGVFYIDELTGRLYLRHLLDYETVPLHVLIITVVDENQPPQRSATFNLNITVHNVNEHPPECSSQIYTVKITETKQVGSSLIQLDCKDKESQHLIYKLYKGDATKFSMKDHGELKLIKEIDTDKEDNFWTVEIEVRDHGVPRLDTFVHVNIFVEDVDDHKPFWHPANNGTYTVSIPENSDVGTFVVMVTAIDDDKPGTKHSKIKYAIEDMTKSFTIESDTGKIIVASPELDREDKDHYKLSVSAHSSDMISEKIFGEISIKITDENDNYPVFSQEIYSATWPEDTKINSVLLTVRASDIDEGRNKQISYSIQGNNDHIVSVIICM
ncbi:cadherin EGF LAG seven-pass G-type receptor 1-like [Mytilus edulis]|uniref:cadherin EGF LAG seven-pass G-type receptor 1-like n=1 Tax=Mytilus edulis TaxID=6550 RepID=UPI0039EE5419